MTTEILSFTRRVIFRGAGALMLGLPALSRAAPSDPWANAPERKLTSADWRARLPSASYDVLRAEGTERPFTSPLNDEHRKGVFKCRGCALPLFKSDWKFDSGTGWPSFYRAAPGAFGKKADFALGIPRTEYHCARCLGHQGHLFDDGPAPTGLRYCNNGVALTFSTT
jgi:peptide-methionine (R)-S-oxide reductase